MSIKNEQNDILPEWYLKPVLVLGCGNVLMGDDGFGPAVAGALEESGKVPEHVYVMNAATSSREILFPMVLDDVPVREVVIVDSTDMPEKGHRPGEIFEIGLEDIPEKKRDDFSMHQVPSSNILRDLRDHKNVKVTILVCQILHIPQEVGPGLSDPVKEAVPRMCSLVLERLG